MGPTQWNHILTLLAITVVVDGRVYKEEVDTFVARTLSLKEETSPSMLFSKKMVFDWFVVHRDEIVAWLKEQDSNCLLYTSPSPRDLSTSRMPSSA